MTNLETVEAYSDYTIEICGNFSINDNPNATNWPVLARIIETQ